MTRPFIARHKFDLDLVFKVKVKDFIMTEDTSFKELPNVHQPDLFDLC